MNSIKKKLQKSLHSQAKKHGNIVIIPGDSDSAHSPAQFQPTETAMEVEKSQKLVPTVREVPVAELIDLGTPEDAAVARMKSVQNDPTWAWTLNDSPAVSSKLLLYLPMSAQARVLGSLPVRDLFSLGCVNRALNKLAKEEADRREQNLAMQLVWRKDFIRYMNQTYNAATKIVLTRHHVFGPIWNNLYLQPRFVVVCYSPDIFEYELRLQVNNSQPAIPTSHNVFSTDDSGQDFTMVKEKPGTLLDNIMHKKAHHLKATDVRPHIWHMRLFTVLKPANDNPPSPSLWSSEDLTLLFFPKNLKMTLTKGQVEYSDLMEYPMLDRYYANHNMLRPMIEMINHRHQPRFLLLSVKEIPKNFQPVVYTFPIIVCDISPFKGYPEEFLCMTGEHVTVFQIILDSSEKREERDVKLRALHRQCRLGTTPQKSNVKGAKNPTQINQVYGRDEQTALSGQWILFYLTEMWPGGTSKECPLADTTLLRNLFPDSPVLGGRGKHFLANQNVSITGPANEELGVLKRLSVPTVVTAILVL